MHPLGCRLKKTFSLSRYFYDSSLPYTKYLWLKEVPAKSSVITDMLLEECVAITTTLIPLNNRYAFNIIAKTMISEYGAVPELYLNN